jgi:hypothetical protein
MLAGAVGWYVIARVASPRAALTSTTPFALRF